MRVLVVAASKHGATLGVAEAIARELREQVADADVWSPRDVRSLDAVDAVIVGSGVYMGRWLAEAKEFIATFRDALQKKPVWLFSVGPIGKPLMPAEEPADAKKLAASIDARGVATFAGRLDKDDLSLIERIVVAALRAPQGDYRDWEAIDAWARSIASVLHSESADASTKPRSRETEGE